MSYEHYIPEALDMVSAWEVPESDFAQAVNNQARLMAGLHMELSAFSEDASPYTPLQF
jgi:hypothetical protein